MTSRKLLCVWNVIRALLLVLITAALLAHSVWNAVVNGFPWEWSIFFGILLLLIGITAITDINNTMRKYRAGISLYWW